MYELKLMFEWGGGVIWCGNDSARDRYGIGPIEDVLPLSKKVLRKLNDLSELHDQALDWDNPPGPSPWSDREFKAFEQMALETLGILRVELGSEFVIQYDVLGLPS